MSTRKRKREAIVAKEHEDALYSAAAANSLALKASQLFVVDRKGSNTRRRNLLKTDTNKNVQGFKLSNTERVLIAKKAKSKSPQNAQSIETANVLSDLWLTEEENVKRNNRLSKSDKKISSRVAVPGQSYNPSVIDHQDALAEVTTNNLVIFFITNIFC